MVWILLAFMIQQDHPNLLTLYSSTYKRRGSLMEKVILDFVAWSFWSSYIGLEIFFVKIDCEQLSNLKSQNPQSRSVWEEKNYWKELDNIKASGCIFIPHYLIQIYFSFLYECYFSILYDSLITYIVSYQIDSFILVFVVLCLFADISHKPRNGSWITLVNLDIQYLKGMFEIHFSFYN